jgi:hypothetical protein
MAAACAHPAEAIEEQCKNHDVYSDAGGQESEASKTVGDLGWQPALSSSLNLANKTREPIPIRARAGQVSTVTQAAGDCPTVSHRQIALST